MKKRFPVSLAALLCALTLTLTACRGHIWAGNDGTAPTDHAADSTVSAGHTSEHDPAFSPTANTTTSSPAAEPISVASVSPQSVLELYQRGEWDGEGRLQSEDGTVQVAKHQGVLRYSYHNPSVDQANYMQSSRDWWNDIVETDTIQYGTRIRSGYSSSNGDGTLDVCDGHYADCYLDLPDGLINEETYGRLIDTFDEGENGFWFITETGVYHFDGGDQLDSWKMPMADNSFLRTRHVAYNFKADYAYDGSRILELLPDGQTKTVLDGVSAGTGYECTFWAHYVENGSLIRWLNWNGKITTTKLVKSGVTEFSDAAGIFLVRKTDGYAYALSGQKYNDRNSEIKLLQLGRGSLEFYQARWRSFRETGAWDLAAFSDYYQNDVTLDVTTACFGQRVMVREGSTYYESADSAGSGKSGSAFYSNHYTSQKLYAYGFASLDSNNRVADSEIHDWSDGVYGRPAPEFCQDENGNIWILIRVNGYEDGALGWFSMNDVYFLPLELE